MLLTVPKGYPYDLFLPLLPETERDSGEVLWASALWKEVEHLGSSGRV